MTTLNPIDPSIVHRRDRLRQTLGDTAALVAAGDYVGRNYSGNPYPFRANSHFLYLMGEGGKDLAKSYLLIDSDELTLYTPEPTAGDALWHGAKPSLDEVGRAFGVKAKPLSELDEAVRTRADKGAIATIPVTCAETRMHQRQLVGRIPDVKKDGPDQKLAEAMVGLRLLHDDHAIRGLEQAAEATQAAHIAGMAATAPGRFEYEVCAAMEVEFTKRGMTSAYGPIVSVHGEVLHNHGHKNEIAAGDLLLADVGAETAGGWAGDVTRTWPVSGTYSPTQRLMYELVLKSQEASIAMCRPGVRYRDVHLKACRVLAAGLVDLGILTGDVDELVADDVHALFFPHGVGHIIGLDVHDMEDLGDLAGYQKGRSRSERFGLGFLRLDRDLLPGMAVTIEPGFYQVPAILNDPERIAQAKGRLNQSELAKFSDVRGIRIEDDVLITADGPRVLSERIPKSVSDVEAAIGAR